MVMSSKVPLNLKKLLTLAEEMFPGWIVEVHPLSQTVEVEGNEDTISGPPRLMDYHREAELKSVKPCITDEQIAKAVGKFTTVQCTANTSPQETAPSEIRGIAWRKPHYWCVQFPWWTSQLGSFKMKMKSPNPDQSWREFANCCHNDWVNYEQIFIWMAPTVNSTEVCELRHISIECTNEVNHKGIAVRGEGMDGFLPVPGVNTECWIPMREIIQIKGVQHNENLSPVDVSKVVPPPRNTAAAIEGVNFTVQDAHKEIECTCSTATLITAGCKCGAMKKE